MDTREITVEKYIKTTLKEELKTVGKKYPYLGFFLIASGIEFLGKCLNKSSDWQRSGESKVDFENAITHFKSLNKYAPYTSQGNTSIKPTISLYNSLRCGLVHAMLPKDNIQLHIGHEKNYVDTKGILHLYFDSFYEDFSNACNELLSIDSWSGGKQKEDIFIIISVDEFGNPSSGTTRMDKFVSIR